MGKGIHRFAIKENSGTNRHNWKYSLAQSCCCNIGTHYASHTCIWSLHNLLYGYYPYTYSYMPLDLWFVLTGLIYGLQVAVLYKQYGLKGLKRALLSSDIQRLLSLLVRIIHESIFRQVMGKHKNHSWICHWQTSNQTINRATANTKDNTRLIYNQYGTLAPC